MVVAVSTGGRSPALSRHLRERIENDISGSGELATLTSELRTDLKEEGVDPEDRRAAMRAVVRSSDVWKALDSPRRNPRYVAVDEIEDVTGDRS